MTIDWAAVGAVSTTVGALAAGAGLVVLAYSVFQVGRSFRASVISQVYGELHHAHHVFVDHPNLRPYFFHDVPVGETDEDYMQARSVAEMYLDIFEQISIMRPYAPRKLRPFFDEYIRDMLAGSSFLVGYLKENEELLYPPRLVEFVRDAQEDRTRGREGVPAPNQPTAPDA